MPLWEWSGILFEEMAPCWVVFAVVADFVAAVDKKELEMAVCLRITDEASEFAKCGAKETRELVLIGIFTIEECAG